MSNVKGYFLMQKESVFAIAIFRFVSTKFRIARNPAPKQNVN
eukprot:CCRYP_004486-RA/>CCRYP_004486-RA protein AED:0.16 eAED:0.17 QI:70/0.5/0.66/1/0.5/0.33/3/2296/41